MYRLALLLWMTTIGFSQVIIVPSTGAAGGTAVGGGASLTTAGQVVCVDAAGLVEECNAATSPAITKAIAATSTDGLLLANTTAATVGAQKWSPRLHWTGRGWGTTAGTSQAVDWITEGVPVEGPVPSARLDFSYSVNGGAYATTMSLLDGNVGIGTSAPLYPLDVQGSGQLLDRVFTSANEAVGRIFAAGNTSTSPTRQWALRVETNNSFTFRDDIASSERLSISSTGNVGIGTTIPLHKNTTVGGSIAVYGSYTATDYYGGTITSTDGALTIAATTLGTGADAQNILFTPAGTGYVGFGADNTYDIGASAANRPRAVYVAGGGTFGGLLSGTSSYMTDEIQGGTTVRIYITTGEFRTRSAGQFQFSSDTTGYGSPDAVIARSGAGIIILGNAGTITDFSRLQFGGTTSSFGALARDGAGLRVVTADSNTAHSFIGMSQARIPASTPANAAAACTADSIWADANYLYRCVASGDIRRVAIATW